MKKKNLLISSQLSRTQDVSYTSVYIIYLTSATTQGVDRSVGSIPVYHLYLRDHYNGITIQCYLMVLILMIMPALKNVSKNPKFEVIQNVTANGKGRSDKSVTDTAIYFIIILRRDVV